MSDHIPTGTKPTLTSNPCCGQASIKQLTTDTGMVYACERCSRHWFRTYENAAGMFGEQERCPPSETSEVSEEMRRRMIADEELSETEFEARAHRIALEAHEDRLKLWESLHTDKATGARLSRLPLKANASAFQVCLKAAPRQCIRSAGHEGECDVVNGEQLSEPQ